MKQFSIAIILIASLLSGCATNTLHAQKSDAVANQYQLTEQKHAYFDSVLVQKPKEESDEKPIFFADLGLQETVINQSIQRSNGLRHKFTLTEKDKAGLKTLYDGAVSSYFSKENGFVTVADPDNAEVIVTADILSITPYAPKDDIKSRSVGTRYYTEGSGNMTVVFNVYQGGQLVMQIEDSRDAGNFWEQNNKIKNKQNVKLLFKSWTRNLAEMLR